VKHSNIIIAALLISFFISPITIVHAQSDLPVVRAVLFYSPTCGHCESVINGTILPLIEKYGNQLQIIAVDVTQQQGDALFLSAIQKFSLERAGVPFLVIDDMYLMGSTDIPEKLPSLIETYLVRGGVALPVIPGLTEALKEPQNIAETTPTVEPVVRAVMFYRSSCSHCQKITEEVIPPLFEKYGTQLEIFGIDVSTPAGDNLYNAAIERFKIEKFGVPTLIVADHVFVGGDEIQDKLDHIIEEYLNQGGVDWPDITGLNEAISKARKADNATVAAPTQAGTQQTIPSSLPINSGPSNWPDLFLRDPAGNALAVLVLAGMLGAIVWAVNLFRKPNGVSPNGNWAWIVPLLCAVGFGVAGYLAYVETTQATAVCGPVGDCNTVQQSAYAHLFGILPIGVLGLIGYAAILVAWGISRFAYGRMADFAAITLLTLTATGTLFSIYLTFLEPFIIGATCAWCLTSAILMTVLMLLVVRPAKAAFSRIVGS
jgi:uncharacterized membrane protein/thiol-disulfide isomerase/thioredoxin